MSFKENLKAELEFNGMLVKELASKTGISKRTIDNYLNSREVLPSIEAILRIAKALNVSVEFLATGKERNAPEKTQKCPRCAKFNDIIEDMEILPQEILAPIKTAIKTFAETERKKRGKKVVSG